MVIDDSSIVRKVERRIVEHLSMIAAEAEFAQEAIDFCKARGLPDAILVDCSLPDMPSSELVTHLRALPGGSRPYILYCATENDAKDIKRALMAGASDYLLKPFTRQDVHAAFLSAGLL
ncbi:MAG: response regulator [Hyphomicrobiaceae bacterium]|nr:response regulator [Hyphomicrobiaceae bacterium]